MTGDAFLFLFTQLLLNLVNRAIEGREDSPRLFPGHEGVKVFRSNLKLDDRSLFVLQIDRHLDGRNAVQKTPQLFRLFGDLFLGAGAEMPMTCGNAD